MSIRVRNAVTVGPFRYIASNAGITVSSTIKGLNAGRGPRGNYVRVGHNGLRFRRIYHPASTASAKHLATRARPPQTTAAATPLTGKTNGALAELVNASPAELLSEINAKLKKPKVAPYVFMLTLLVLLLLAWAKAPSWLLGAIWFVGLAITMVAHLHDLVRRSVVILYDFAPPAAAAYEQLYIAIQELKRCRPARRAPLPADAPLRAALFKPPLIQANVNVPVWTAPQRKLVFLPDRLLIFEGKRAGAVPYHELHIEILRRHFLPPGFPRAVVKMAGHTRPLVNRNGPHHPHIQKSLVLPVTAYETIHLRSLSGLDEAYQACKPGSGRKLQRAVKQLGAVLT